MSELEYPKFKSFWMWQDRYMITVMKTWWGKITYTTCLYEVGQLVTDGTLYGNDY